MNKKNTTIPDWMRGNESYAPPSGQDSFIFKTSKAFSSLLARFHSDGVYESRLNPTVALFSTLFLIILIVLSQNLLFPLGILSYLILRIAFLPGEVSLQIFRGAFTGAFFACLFLLPALLMGYEYTAALLISKTVITVLCLGLLSFTCSFHKITHALHTLHIPSIFILIMDITLLYIHILGNICLNMLTALKLRSVGHTDPKQHSFAGILGTVYLKSSDYAKHTHDAMVCRGFDGEYHQTYQQKICIWDFVMLLFTLLCLICFIYLKLHDHTTL